MITRKYPLGKQDFPKLRNEGFVYVDKTKYAFELANLGGSYFLSKPRRFGKSLFISTLESIFLGKKELFEGLYIHDKWQFEEYPIIRISFSEMPYENNLLSDAISERLLEIAELYGIEITKKILKSQFKELITKLHMKFEKEVVILIDEYDKPLIDYLDKDNIDQALNNRKTLKSFYSILKDAEKKVKLLLITGVSKFSKVSIFSDLNNLTDISTNIDFSEICGISQQELEENFKEELKIYDKEKIKDWYNGYKFNPKSKTLYNPYSILNFFYGKGEYKNFWYETGTPTFLMKMCRDNHLYKFDEIKINKNDLGNFDIENLKIEPLLFQTGYLTIKEEDPLFEQYTLSFPNKEVKASYLSNLMEAYIDSQQLQTSPILNGLRTFLKTKDPNTLKENLNQAFSHIPCSLWQKENEQYYHALVHLIFSLLGVYIFSEVLTQKGRTDSIVMFENEVFIFEFKLNKSAEEAFFQIENKGYADKFKDNGMPIYKIGVNFCSDKKEVEEVWLKQG